jgi:hypothetical protein
MRPMGARYMKVLKHNGIAVAEYLGSDDPDEDVVLAREVLRAKGIKPPTLLGAMFGQANSFAHAANRIYKEDVMGRSPDKPVGFAPFVVNAAFSVEIYLKTLHAVAGDSRRGHPLLPLYDALPDARRAELCAEAALLASQHGEGPQVQFRELLTMLNSAFDRWRYFYEAANSGKSTIHLQQTILVMHASRDVCARAVAAANP